jgi:hypothetical protein
VLSSLELLSLEFQSPQSGPDRETRCPPPSIRFVIPALLRFTYKGVIEYLEDLISRIHTPKLDYIRITFFIQTDFNTPRLAQFINSTPELEKCGVTVLFCDDSAIVMLSPGSPSLKIEISRSKPDRQLSSIEQICNSSLYQALSTVEYLYIQHYYWQRVWKDDDIENTLWLQFLLPFTAVKNLYLFKEFVPGIAAALQELDGGRITEVLPSLRNIFVRGLEPSGLFQENIDSLLPHDSSPITLSPFLTGTPPKTMTWSRSDTAHALRHSH